MIITVPFWIELSKSAFLHNLAVIKDHVGTAERMPCIKADAYGHGLTLCAQALEETDVQWVTVHSPVEAEIARSAGYIKNILILGPVAVEDLQSIQQTRARFFLTSLEHAQQLLASLPDPASSFTVHIKLDTGLHRLGLQEPELPAFLTWLAGQKNFVVEGLATHFANADQRPDTSLFDRQVARFQRSYAVIQQQYPKIRCHVANSSATLLSPELHMSGVRTGLSSYGYTPATHIPTPDNEPLQPVLQLRTRISSITTVEAGETVGYGATWTAPARSRIAVLPIGYFDGYDRRFSNTGVVIINGQRARIAGRICMNMCMVDITAIPACQVGDKVTLIGTDGQESIWATELAASIETIPYELLSRLHPDIPRSWVA